MCQSVLPSLLASFHQANRHQDVKKIPALSLMELVGEIGMHGNHMLCAMVRVYAGNYGT